MKPHHHGGLLLLPRLTIRQANRLLVDDVISVQDLCRYCYALAVSGEQVWKLNAFARLVSLDEIMEKARQSDDRRRKRRGRGGDMPMLSPPPLLLLDGIPFSVKANLAIASQKLTAGSRILGAAAAASQEDQDDTTTTTTAGYTADVVCDLESSGAILMGVTNMDEFGMGSLGTHQPRAATGGIPTTFTKNPMQFLQAMQQRHTLSVNTTGNEMEQIKKTMQSSMDEILEMHEKIATSQAQTEYYSAGGSSCGSAASVAHGSSLISLGSDTGGSVRLPASWCGVVGLKPSYGRLSRHGLVSYASSLDTVGLLAPSADCAALGFQQLVQPYTATTAAKIKQQQQRRRIVDSTHSLRQAEFLVRTNILDDNDSKKHEMILKGLRVGLPEAFSVEECPIAIQRAWSQSAQILQSHGATVETVPAHVISPDVLKSLLAAYYVLVCAEASSNLARYDGFRYGVGVSAAEIDFILDDYCRAKERKKGTIDGDDNTNKLATDLSLLEWQYAAARNRGFGPEVQRRILCGTAVLSSDRFHTYYEAAAKLRAVATQQLHSCLRQSRHGDKSEGNSNGGGHDPQRYYFDMLLVPTTLYPPPRLDGDSGENGGSKMDSTEMFANDIMTVPASLAGLPAVSVPFGDSILLNEDASGSQSSSRPAPASCFFRPGMQLIGARQQEDRILQVAAVLEMQSRIIHSSDSIEKR